MCIIKTVLKRRLALVVLITFYAVSSQNSPFHASSTPTPTKKENRIVFVSDRDGYPEITLMNADGSNLRALKNPEQISYASGPVWSLNGNYLAYSLHYDDGKDTLLYVTNATDLVQQVIALKGSNIPAQPSWSPDSKQIAYVSNQDSVWKIFVVSLDTKKSYRLTSIASSKPRTDYSPIWSPIGDYIAFLSDEEYGINSELHIIRPDGSGEQVLARDPQSPMSFSWSPDGQRIAFITTYNRLCTVNLEKQESCFQNVKNPSSPSWSPDGRLIAYSAETDGINSIFTVTNDGNQIKQITNDKTHNAFNPVWSPDGKLIAFVLSQSDEGSNIAVIDNELLSQQSLTVSQGAIHNYSPAWQP